MTLEKAKNLKEGTILYELDSCLGPHQRTVTTEKGHTWDMDDPLVSLDHLTREFDIAGKETHYPCYCFFESYDECRSHEMSPYDQW